MIEWSSVPTAEYSSLGKNYSVSLKLSKFSSVLFSCSTVMATQIYDVVGMVVVELVDWPIDLITNGHDLDLRKRYCHYCAVVSMDLVSNQQDCCDDYG